MSATRVQVDRQTKVRRKASVRPQAPKPAGDPVQDVARVPAASIRLRLNYTDPLDYRPRTTNLAELRMEFDDVQVLRYLYRHHAPRRHLEFGTWEGRGALYCLEESPATVWTVNLLEGEPTQDGRMAYHRLYDLAAGTRTPGRYVRGGDSVEPGSERRAYQTDSYEFIGRLVHEAGLGHRLCQIFSDSRQWDISPYPPGFFDTVLIDGGHDPDTVISDTRKAMILARAGGLVLWHDFCPEPAVFERTDCSCHGVIEGLRRIWPEVANKLSDVFWVENTWLLIGVRAAEAAPAAGKDTPNVAAPRGAAALDGAVAALRAELQEFARQREARARLEMELESTRARLAAVEERRGAAERTSEQVHGAWLATLAGLDSQVAALGAAQGEFIASLTELRAGLDNATEGARADANALTELRAALDSATERGRVDAEALQRASAENGRLAAELRAVVAAKEAAERLAQDVSARLDAAQRQAETDITRFTAVEAEQRATAEALRAELARLTAGEAEQRAIADTIRAELARRDEAIAGLAKNAEELRQRSERAEAEATRLDGEAKAQNLKILDLVALRRVQTERLEDREAQVARLEGEAAQLRQTLADTEASLASVSRAREHLATHAAALEASIREIRASTSWRVTGPLRKVSAALRRSPR